MIAAELIITIEFYGHDVRTIIASCNTKFRTSHNNFLKRRDDRPQIPELKLVFLFFESTLLLMKKTFFLILYSKLLSYNVLNFSQVAIFPSKMVIFSGEIMLSPLGIWERTGNILSSAGSAASHSPRWEEFVQWQSYGQILRYHFKNSKKPGTTGELSSSTWQIRGYSSC